MHVWINELPPEREPPSIPSRDGHIYVYASEGTYETGDFLQVPFEPRDMAELLDHFTVQFKRANSPPRVWVSKRTSGV